jgi:ribosomal protein S18 acetylase RimI-like enzyme
VGLSPADRPAYDRALDLVLEQLALGHPVLEADGARFVRDPSLPRIYDANFVFDVRAATPAALDRLLARVEVEYAGVGHRVFRLDPRTPPAVAARLALEGYARSDSLVMLLEGEPGTPAANAPCEIHPVASEDDWAAYGALRGEDFAETFRRREPGTPADLAIAHDLVRANRGKCPPMRYGLAVADGTPCGFLGSWEGTDGVGQVEDLFVDRRFRRRGIARALLLHGIADARRRGAGPVAIVADPTDTPMRLYAALGFRPLALCSLFRRGV